MNLRLQQRDSRSLVRTGTRLRRGFRVRYLPHQVFNVAFAAFALAVVASGCGQKSELNSEYGGRRGRAATSVNGISILADMFRETGARSTTVLNLSSRLDKYDVVILAPANFTPPSEDVREFIDDWLAAKSGRTFVFIGRDYDAAGDYWQAMFAQTPAQLRVDIMRREAQARAAHGQARIDMPEDDCCEWFVMRRDLPGRRVRTLSGPWSKGVKAAETHIWSQGRLDIPTSKELKKLWKNDAPTAYLTPDYTPVLVSGKETLAFKVTKPAWGSSRIIVIANGSFLLNLPLVNHQHRKLAGTLIDQCQPFSGVAFVEASPWGLSVLGKATEEDKTSLRGRVLLAAHWFLLGVVCCLFAFPIFGRPKTVVTESVADFGQHADAMAALLERTGDVGYAQRQLAIFRKGQHLTTLPRRDDAGEATSKPAAPGNSDSTSFSQR